MRVVLLAIALVLGGCTYERVISRRAALAGLPGAESGVEYDNSHLRTLKDPTATGEVRLVIEQPDGSVILKSPSGRHLMMHIYTTIEAGDRDLFTDQLLSEVTRREFYDRGYDPGHAFDELVRRQDDVYKLFSRMPMGEYTPGVLWRSMGQKTMRLEVTGQAARDLRWNFMDMVLEYGDWKLRWFGRS